MRDGWPVARFFRLIRDVCERLGSWHDVSDSWPDMGLHFSRGCLGRTGCLGSGVGVRSAGHSWCFSDGFAGQPGGGSGASDGGQNLAWAVGAWRNPGRDACCWYADRSRSRFTYQPERSARGRFSHSRFEPGGDVRSRRYPLGSRRRDSAAGCAWFGEDSCSPSCDYVGDVASVNSRGDCSSRHCD